MTKHPSPEMASPDAADRGDSSPDSEAPASAAAAGAVGPGALAAVEVGGRAVDAENGLSPDDLAIMSRLVQRVGVGPIRRYLDRYLDAH